jgi:hypothetical protein
MEISTDRLCATVGPILGRTRSIPLSTRRASQATHFA